MTSQRSQGASSPSASSIFLPLGRRGSRSSLSTQAEREGLNAALDQIHTAAYQSDSLTVFNDFTSPPAPTSVTEDKSLSNEIQGGLSGLYSRLRTSVGGVRDIVRVGRSSERGHAEDHKVKSPPRELSLSRSAHGPVTSAADGQEFPPTPIPDSGLQSPVPAHQQPYDASHLAGTGKGSKVSSKTASISSKASISAPTAIKSPVPPLQKATASSTAVDPTVTEVNVNAVKDFPVNASNNSGNLSSHSFHANESASIDRDEASQNTSMSASGWNQRLTQSPILQPKSQNPSTEGLGSGEAGRAATMSPQVTGRSDSLVSHGTDISIPATSRKSKPSIDGSQDSGSFMQERRRSNSTASFNPDRSNPAAYSESNSVSQSQANGDNTFTDGQTPSTGATSLYLTDGDSRSRESSKPSLKEKARGRRDPPALLPLPRSLTPSESTVSSPLWTPVNVEASDRGLVQDDRGWHPPKNDGNMPHLGNKLLSREFWMRDENSKDCFHCGEPFSTFRRKHHCRTCGQIFDSKCTLLIPGERFGQPGTIRVCKPCEAMINGHDDDSSEFSDGDQSPAVNPRLSELGSPAIDDDDASSVISQSIEHALKTPTMAIPATRRAGEGHNRRSAVLEISPDRPLARPTSSRSLKSSLSGRTHSIGHKRHHSRQQFVRNFKPYHDDRAPFQRRNMEDATSASRLSAFHKDNIIDPDLAQYLSDDASSGDEQPNILSAASETPLSKSSADNERTTFGGFGILAAMKKGRSAFGSVGSNNNHYSRDFDEGSVSSSRALNLPRPRRRNLSVASSIQRNSPRASKDSVLALHDQSNANHILPAVVTPSGFKMTRSSSMRGAGAPPVELNKASLQHVRQLLRQLLKDAAVPHANSWETALLPILLKAADEVDPDVHHGDDMDIRHYIKLKKIPGGRPGDTSYVSGLVFTKNLALKSMPRSIPQPRILIITFPLEYARHQQHFMSLEPLIRQEREFLENLVSRIAALKPNLLLVEKNVSGLALELLEKANIATALNVKSSVLEAVSRCTQTKIITSMDKLVTTPVTSECGSFDVKTYVANGRKKTYMYLSGCRKELGCTIVLRGSDNEVLSKVKRITEFMAYVVYNLRLETCLMRDEFAKIPTAPNTDAEPKHAIMARQSTMPTANPGDNTAPDSTQDSDEKKGSGVATSKPSVTSEVTEVPDDVPMPTYYQDIVQDHETKILSASPFVKFEPPYLLTRAREMERRLEYLKRLRDQDVNGAELSDEKAKPQKFVLITSEMVHESPQNAPPKVKEILHAAHDAEYDRALHHYQTQKRQWEAYISGTMDMFDPYAHQNIVVLFSLVCTASSIPCAGPDLIALEYYNEHEGDSIFDADCTLGQFVEDICLNANAVCNVNGCEKRMFEHHRQFVHGEAQISVFSQPHAAKLPGLQDIILMWSVCKICGNETQVFPMSDNTWKYSFGKYLELSFWGRNLHARAGVCPHDLQRDHIRYFGFKDVAVRIRYDPINLLEIIVPRPQVTWKVDNDLVLKNEVYLKMEQRINKFMHSVKQRLKGINVDSVIPKLADDCNKEIESLTRKANEDHSSLVKQLQDKYMDSRYWEVIPMNEVLRSVQEKVVEWDTAFAEFEKNFFPSEKDIRRLATLQLKKIFLDKDASVTSDEITTTPTEAESESSEEPQRLRPMRRMTLSPEKAQDVLVSVVEEHARKNKSQDEKPSQTEETDSTAPSPSPEDKAHLPPQVDPEGTREKEIQHLDLALSSRCPDQSTVEATLRDSAERADSEPARLGAKVNPTTGKEQEQHGQNGGNESPEQPVEVPTTPTHLRSAIPRPAENPARRNGKATSPPLVRAQSQPAHLQKAVYNDSSIFKPLKIGTGKSSGSDGASRLSDKKLADRLGLSALRNSKLTQGPSLIPRSIPNKKPTRVSYLAKHFEQLSREFEKERQRERAQRAAKGTHSRAYPLASSKPIVEVYKNVREAVEEREPSGDGEDSMHSLVPVDDSSRGSDEFTKRPHEGEPGAEPPTEKPAATEAEKEATGRAEDQTSSDGEGEDGRSEGDRASTELQRTESGDEIPRISPDEEQMDLKELPKHERSTLLKLLTNFWSERSASGWTPLDYPLAMSDHVFADCDIVVREDEPSSLIAFALDSQDYKEKLASIQRRYEEQDKELDPQGDPRVFNEARIEHALLRSTGTHLKYQFQEGQAKMLCKVFYAEQFDALRKKCGVSERIVESLSRCAKWDSKGGKTKSLFLKTLDDRFILKSLAPIETQAFLKFAPAYFQIMSEALFHELPSAIAKMFGFYQVIIKNPATGAEFNWYLLLMENLFYDREPTRIFDLKGSMRNRKVQSTGERDEVLLDENMVDFIYETPLFAREHSKKILSQSVWNDTLFLGRQNVMDYSLMIAIDEGRSELVVGVIDCIRTYTWDKKLESWIKDRGFAGGGKNRPTVTSPKEYKSRFREAMARYVLQAPRQVYRNPLVVRKLTGNSCWHQFQQSQLHRYAPIEPQSSQSHSGADGDAEQESFGS